MKHNMHYKPPKKRRKNPPRKGPTIPLDECVVMLAGPTDPRFFEDKRKDKTKCGQVVVPEDPKSLTMYITDASTRNPGRGARRQKRSRRGNKKTEAPAANVSAETKSVEALATPRRIEDVQQAQTEAIQAKQIGDVPGIVMPKEPTRAFSLGVVQGYEIARRDCPTSDVLGVGILFPKWKRISKVIEEQKKDEAARVLASAQEPFESIEPQDQLLADFDKAGSNLALTEGISATGAYIQGVYMGKLYGYKACPFKWMPFNKSMAEIRYEIKDIEIWKDESLREYLRQNEEAIETMLSIRERRLGS